MYLLNLGHTFPFSHTTTLDKYLYEAELRTGMGAHYRYSDMMHETLVQLESYIPGISGHLFIGHGAAEL